MHAARIPHDLRAAKNKAGDRRYLTRPFPRIGVVKGGPRKPRPISAALRVAGPAALRRWNSKRPLLPKCGATARSTGQPCGQLALDNGRCRWHGGRTPKGKDWHAPVYVDGKRPDGSRKVDRKLRDRDRAAKKRDVRLVAMSPEERAAHAEWHKSHKPRVDRARLREERRQDREAAAVLSSERPRPSNPELEAITADLRRAEEILRRLEDRAIADGTFAEGVFG